MQEPATRDVCHSHDPLHPATPPHFPIRAICAKRSREPSHLSMIETDSEFKVVLVGDAKVGKSCLMTRYLSGFYSNCYVRTLGADFKIKCIDTEAPRYKLQIWDTGGESFLDGSLEATIRNTQAVLICYDVTNKASFREIPKWVQQVQLHCAVDCVICLVGCKSDSYVSRKVSREEGEKMASEYNCHFEECSAKKSINVDKIFKDVATLMKKQLLEISIADIEEERKEEVTLLTRRSTITDANCKVQQGAYPIHVAGACSWVNSHKINGRYVPRIMKLRPSDAVEEFCFVNVDSLNTVMVYRDNHWLIKRNRKEMASVYSPSIQCFPDEASSRNQWQESGGVYFTWMRLQPHIQCTALSAAAALALSAEKGLDLNYGPNKALSGGSAHGLLKGLPIVRGASFSVSREERVSFTHPQLNAVTLRRTVSNLGMDSSNHTAKMSNSSCHGLSVLTECGRGSAGLADAIFVSAGRGMGGILDVNAFLECIQQPELHLGLSLALFTQFIRLRLALLEYEYRNTNDKYSGWESGALVQICAQTLRIHETCADYLRKANLGDAGPTEPTVDAILLAGKAFLRQLSKHLASLCSVEKGAFEQARQCRDVKVQVEGYLNDLCPEYTSRASFNSYSISSRASFSGGSSPRSPLSPM